MHLSGNRVPGTVLVSAEGKLCLCDLRTIAQPRTGPRPVAQRLLPRRQQGWLLPDSRRLEGDKSSTVCTLARQTTRNVTTRSFEH